MNMLRIRRIRDDEVAVASKLVKDTFKRFNFNEGTKKGVAAYINAYDPSKNIKTIQKSFERTPLCFCAFEDNHMIGVIRGLSDRLINLFVDGNYHRIGVGTKLLLEFEKACYAQGSKKIKTNATIFAVPFYQQNGYKKTTGIRNLSGLKVQPMKKLLNLF